MLLHIAEPQSSSGLCGGTSRHISRYWNVAGSWFVTGSGRVSHLRRWCSTNHTPIAMPEARQASSASISSRCAGSCPPASRSDGTCGGADDGRSCAPPACAAAPCPASTCCGTSVAPWLCVGASLEQRSDGMGSGCCGGPTKGAAVPAAWLTTPRAPVSRCWSVEDS